MSPETTKKYEAKIKQFSEELALELLQNEQDLEKKFLTLDQQVLEILIDVGNRTMSHVGRSLQDSIKKKPPNQV
jgi:hypothetical protein